VKHCCLTLLALLSVAFSLAAEPIKHGFLATGNETFIVDADGKTTWKYPHASRDGWVLPSGNILLALSKSKTYPKGAVVEVNLDGKVLFEFKGTQAEVNTVQPLSDGKILLTEAGDKPRILEVNRDGKVLVEVAIQAQVMNHHLQTRMTRKLTNGNYLVPQLTDRVVREYDATGKVIWEVKTPNMPFTAIRLNNGHTVIGCTLGNLIIEVDGKGQEVWRFSNDDLPNKPISDICGAQRLANGNTVFTSYRAGKGQPKLFEVTPDKKLVWTYNDERKSGIHHFQILGQDGKSDAKELHR
jgi:outer membrane protein assembly factor BamB